MKSLVIGTVLGVEKRQTSIGQGVITLAVRTGLDSQKFTIWEQKERNNNTLYEAVSELEECEPVAILVNHFMQDGREKIYVNYIFTGDVACQLLELISGN